MSSEGAPESWDQDVANNLQKLNVNASAFVPNVNATEFVPSWGTPSPKPEQSAENSAQPSKKYVFYSPLVDRIQSKRRQKTSTVDEFSLCFWSET